jgi:hypothetical protein
MLLRTSGAAIVIGTMGNDQNCMNLGCHRFLAPLMLTFNQENDEQAGIIFCIRLARDGGLKTKSFTMLWG